MARIVRADRLMHGKTSPIHHDGRELFAGLSNPFDATRYHSLLIERASLPPCLEITAWTAEGEIMGVRHRDLPLWGVQFHPESILTVEGKQIAAEFPGDDQVKRKPEFSSRNSGEKPSGTRVKLRPRVSDFCLLNSVFTRLEGK